MEDVLIITADRTLEGFVDDIAPVEQEREAARRRPDSGKERSREKEDAGKAKVQLCCRFAL